MIKVSMLMTLLNFSPRIALSTASMDSLPMRSLFVLRVAVIPPLRMLSMAFLLPSIPRTIMSRRPCFWTSSSAPRAISSESP